MSRAPGEAAGAGASAGEGRISLRVYYEDTDLAGIVYYANYLKFIERGRSEWVRDLGIDQARLKAEAGLVFAVRRVEADYLKPARFDDMLVVVTRLVSLGGARLVLAQEVRRRGGAGEATPSQPPAGAVAEELLFTATVTLVCLGAEGQPARLPADLRARLAG